MQTRTAPRSLLLIAYLVFFIMAIPAGVLNVAWTYMQRTFGVPLDALGILLLANTCGALLGTFFSGRLIETFGMGRYLTTGGVIMALGLLGYVAAPSWLALLAAAFITTLGFSAFNAGLNTFVSTRYTAGQFNWLHASFGLGQTIGPTLATIIVERLGQSWHLNYLVVFVLILSVTVLLAYTRQRWNLSFGKKPGDRAERIPLLESLRIPAVLLGMSIFFVSSGVIASTGQLSNTLLTARGIEQAGFWISVYWASFTVGRIIMGFIAHRLDNTHLLRASLIGAAIGAALLWQNASAALNLAGLMIIGLSCAPLYPTLIAETHHRIEARHRLNAIGFQMSAAGLGQSIVPGTIALVAQHTTVGAIAPALLIGALVAVALHEAAARRQAVTVPA